ncbi:Olfactory receptor 7E24 [Sciurus carolinensis]|uniref:Olfactory receptor 7E24 n=1 Tax=Sciurus carolinensis TaxID=30640 RepID=A0AA41N6K8_SCICA|nr:Olfactory receptor 7E24 [Sciurus carolinensis]
MIVNTQIHSRVISYVGCLTQMSLFIIFGGMDGMLLTVMAYDRFVAICHPLHYPVIMSPHLCGFLVLISFLVSFLDCQLHNLIALNLPYFKDVEIANFFCDSSQILNLACFETFTRNIVTCFVPAISGFCTISGILFSYYKIVSPILSIPSSSGKYKDFSTCLTSQLFVYFMEQALECTLDQLYLILPEKPPGTQVDFPWTDSEEEKASVSVIRESQCVPEKLVEQEGKKKRTWVLSLL